MGGAQVGIPGVIKGRSQEQPAGLSITDDAGHPRRDEGTTQNGHDEAGSAQLHIALVQTAQGNAVDGREHEAHAAGHGDKAEHIGGEIKPADGEEHSAGQVDGTGAAGNGRHGKEAHHAGGVELLHVIGSHPAAGNEEDEGNQVVGSGCGRSHTHFLAAVHVQVGPGSNLHTHIEELGNHAAPVARLAEQGEQHAAVVTHQEQVYNRAQRAAENPGYFVHIREQEVEHRERHNGEKRSNEHTQAAALALYCFSRSLLRILGTQEEQPDEEGDTAETHIGSADPEQLIVHNFLELLCRHDRALISSGGVQVAQNQLLSQQDTGNGTHRVEGLGKVQAAHSRLIRPEGNHVGIAGGFQHRATAGHHENGDEINLEALVDTGRNVAQCTGNINTKTNEDALLIGEFLNQDGGKDSQHSIGAVESNLHQGGLFLRNRKDILEGRHKVIRHIIQQAPQGKAADQHKENRAVLTRYHRRQILLNFGIHVGHSTIISPQVNQQNECT